MLYNIYKIDVQNKHFKLKDYGTKEARSNVKALENFREKDDKYGMVAIKQPSHKRIDNIFASDFECNNSENNGKVWAWGIEPIGQHKKFKYGNNIESYMQYIMNLVNLTKRDGKHITIYFHNLSYDASRILIWLFNNNFKQNETKEANTFHALIDKSNKMYYIKMYIKNVKNETCTIEFRDSFKKIPLSIEKMSKAFGLTVSKGDLNYNEIRDCNHIITKEELSYLKNDVAILSEALTIQYDNDLTHLTIGSDAIAEFKRTVGEKFINTYLLKLTEEEDAFIRKTYHGGYNYCVSGKVGEGLGLDKNSHYSYQMHSKSGHYFPIGKPQYFVGKYEKDEKYDLYIQHISVSFALKDGHLPFIKDTKINNNEFIQDTYGDSIELYLTNEDLKLLFEQYDIDYIEYIDGYKFQSIIGMFDKYIDKYMKMKIENNDNISARMIAKLMLNNLYGKFGTLRLNINKQVEIENGILKNKTKDVTYNEITLSRVDIASFITSYGRCELIRLAQKAYEQNIFLYCDTDSIHIKGKTIPEYFKIDNTELGAWKIETDFQKGIFIKCKVYAEFINSKWNIKCSGMTETIHKELEKREDFENIFKPGFSTMKYEVKGNLRPKQTQDGIILIDKDFSIKGGENNGI